MIRLENWSCGYSSDDRYAAPELSRLRLLGVVADESNKRNGKRIQTSAVTKIDGRVITTASGSVYELGEVDPAYLAWIREQGREFNPEQPIADKRKS